jgi:hypothetical protein
MNSFFRVAQREKRREEKGLLKVRQDSFIRFPSSSRRKFQVSNNREKGYNIILMYIYTQQRVDEIPLHSTTITAAAAAAEVILSADLFTQHFRKQLANSRRKSNPKYTYREAALSNFKTKEVMYYALSERMRRE